MGKETLVIFFGFRKAIPFNTQKVNKQEVKIHEENNTYTVVYTSFTNPTSKLITYDQSGKAIEEFPVKDIGLENLIFQNNILYFSSRYSGNYYTFDNKSVQKHSIPSSWGITNSFANPNGIHFITNGGQFVKDNKPYYKSGLVNVEGENQKEFKYEKGFFTTGISYKDFYYVLTFDPSIEQEQVLKIDSNGEAVKAFNLGNKPQVGHKSMAVSGDKIYLVSDKGKMFTIFEDSIKELELPTKSKVFQVLEDNGKVFILYYSGEVVVISGEEITNHFKLEQKNKNPIINMKALINKNSLHILSLYDGENKSEGIIQKYNINNGKLEQSVTLPKEKDLKISTFELTR
ncbi:MULTISPECIES: hypothetical protein [Bacillus]|uniref:hypothetical protein n=1 Tax=Bacillus TaxID=1386 RepID=UPI0015731ABC|nr:MULTISPECIES: hypothetical protein [Bacillus]MBC6972007.1 hypothetical protein [Bacillus sp. Xin]MBY0599166.1 hypothetical protein [Bacillus bingmayongensis]NSW39192.1 hypothetical protein [Bacillus sp. Xin1]